MGKNFNNKNNDFNVETFAKDIYFIACRTPIAAERELRLTIIANSNAGGFTIKKRGVKHSEELKRTIEIAAAMPQRRCVPSETAKRFGGELGAFGLVKTSAPGTSRLFETAASAENITAELLKEAAAHREAADKPFFLVISAGGDGTTLEIFSNFYKEPETHKNDFVFLRLPMGTGNDGADAQTLETALSFLLKPRKIQFTSAITLKTSNPNKGPFFAFNILSVGLDAFVTHSTNKMKNLLPGDSYKLWVDIAALFYNKIYNVGLMEVRAYDKAGSSVQKFRDRALLLAVGAGGRRTYGAGNNILPDERNVCMIREMPLLRKLSLKGKVARGTHTESPETLSFSANSIRFIAENPILAQMDGETVLLEPNDFPAVIELSEPVIPVLSRGQ
ncbi:hypothetical protein AGMMS50212_04000 [Spirochaetia bacterium]|nr:hypothetical protein AGMMS50212_04000 [Spirochaetia bacterium]